MKSTSATLIVALVGVRMVFAQTPTPSVLPSISSRPTNVSAVLDAWEASEKQRQCFVLQYEYTSEQDSLYKTPDYARFSGKEKHCSQGEVHYDGSRVFLSNTEWAESENKNLVISKEKPKQRAWLWDGKVHYFHTPGISLIATVEQGSFGLHRLVPTAAPRGYLCEMDDPVDVVARRSGSSWLRPALEMIGGSPCVVIEATGKEGRQTLWIDTQRGNNLVKAQVHIAEGNLLRGKPLEKGILIDATLSKVQLRQINGTWFPTEYAYDYSQLFPTGHIQHHDQCSFSGIKVNPDLDALRAFVPATIEDGLQVKLTGDKLKKRYTWRKGQIVDEQGLKVEF